MGCRRWIAVLALAAAGCVPRMPEVVPLELIERRVVAEPDGERVYALRFRDTEGVEVDGFLRRPAAPAPPRTGVVLVAGRETGREAAAVIPGPLEEIVLALEYPAELPVTGAAGEWVRRLPGMRRTAYRMPGMMRGAARWLAAQEEVDAGRMALVGVSYGVPFAAAAGRDPLFRGVTLQHGGADLALLLRENLPIRNRLLRAAAASFGARYLRSLEPARHVGRISPTPLLLINALHDEMIPPASAARLRRAAREPVRQLWLPHGHLMPGDHAQMRELADSTLAHFHFLREPPRAEAEAAPAGEAEAANGPAGIAPTAGTPPRPPLPPPAAASRRTAPPAPARRTRSRMRRRRSRRTPGSERTTARPRRPRGS
jgi:dienelactone hydrolase